ncbi:arsB [Acanthosepion pharaonis]|uniref:ArsB n=1 Tax=Acanthosepion pharaonis TaxID=158019 RepID=A0A812ALS7_ACAPH|nr:arsB [Sepia pharaonis]
MRCVHLFYFFISSNFISSFFIFIPVPTAYTGALFLWHIIIVTFNFFNNDPFLAGNSSSTFISIFISTTFAVSPCSSPPSSDVHSASLSLHFALVTYFFCRKTSSFLPLSTHPLLCFHFRISVFYPSFLSNFLSYHSFFYSGLLPPSPFLHFFSDLFFFFFSFFSMTFHSSTLQFLLLPFLHLFLPSPLPCFCFLPHLCSSIFNLVFIRSFLLPHLLSPLPTPDVFLFFLLLSMHSYSIFWGFYFLHYFLSLIPFQPFSLVALSHSVVLTSFFFFISHFLSFFFFPLYFLSIFFNLHLFLLLLFSFLFYFMSFLSLLIHDVMFFYFFSPFWLFSFLGLSHFLTFPFFHMFFSISLYFPFIPTLLCLFSCLFLSNLFPLLHNISSSFSPNSFYVFFPFSFSFQFNLFFLLFHFPSFTFFSFIFILVLS